MPNTLVFVDRLLPLICHLRVSLTLVVKAYWIAKNHIIDAKRTMTLQKKMLPLRIIVPQIRSLPIKKDDEVMITRGNDHDRPGRVVQVYRKMWRIYVDGIKRSESREGLRGIHPSNVQITKLKLDKDRKAIIARKKSGKKSQKYTQADMVD
eukprot:GHVU01129249.1.p1 GENE.GHVU01129249.1~~GHVU01129249.1.p1  ORF type:complete len:151 (-),score=16.07 GHVU01129249.1:240-692(-)